MGIDLNLISRIIYDGDLRPTWNKGVSVDLIYGESEKEIFRYIEDHYRKYSEVPSLELISSRFGTELIEPEESIDYWADEVLNRSLFNLLSESSEEINRLMQDRKPQQALEKMREIVARANSRNVGGRVKIENLFSLPMLDLVKQRYEDAKLGKMGILTPWRSMDEMTMGWWPGDISFLAARPGVGKCHPHGTKILMFDGSIKEVQDIILGDQLMGPDSRARKVTSVCRGREEIFKIQPVKGEAWKCNRSHVLSLRMSSNNGKIYHAGEIINLSIDEYLKTNKKFKHHAKLWRTGVEFNECAVSVDPYWMGLWIGDGTSIYPNITTGDIEIKKYLQQIAIDTNHHVKIVPGHGCETLCFSGTGKPGQNHFLNSIRESWTGFEKRIPQNFLINSRQRRLALLAGLIDSDGYLGNGTYEISTKYDGLKDDILHLARSLGFGTSFVRKKSTIKTTGFSGLYWRINIFGDLSVVPVLIPRKKCPPRKQIKNILNTGFSIQPCGNDYYYGFTLDGDHLYLLGDFTVTHNTWSAALISVAARNQGKRARIISCEMSKEDVATRILSIIIKMQYGAIRKGRLGLGEAAFFSELDQLKEKTGIDIVDCSKGMTSMDVDLAVESAETDIVIVDAAYRIKGGGKIRDLKENMSVVVDDLKSTAQRYKLPIVATTQLNRASVKNKDGGTENMALSDVIGWNATNIFQLDQNKEQFENRVMHIKPIKVREGENAGKPIEINWDMTNMDFAEIEPAKQKMIHRKDWGDDDF